jgi:16S rRNA (adenine1518-N6/adenine1519-N6)-dimethyltransferase
LDRDFGPQLAEKYSSVTNIEVVQADALKVDFAALLNENPTPAKLIGNLPYYITSDLLLKFFSVHEMFSELVVMVQLEVAERICAESGTRDYGVLSVTSQLYCDCRMILKVPPEAFTPRPKVHSSVVRLKVNPKMKSHHVDEAGFLSFAKKCFAQKRKTLMNNLREVYPQDQVECILSSLALSANVRAEAIPFEQLCEIYRSLNVLAGA